MTTTVVFTDDFTGTNQDPFNTTNWSTFKQGTSPGSTTVAIVSNAGQISLDGNFLTTQAGATTVATPSDQELYIATVKKSQFSRPGGVGVYGINMSDTAFNNGTSDPSPYHGIWIWTTQGSSVPQVWYRLPGGSSVQITPTTAFTSWAINTTRSIRMKYEAGRLYVKIWTGTEPATWNVDQEVLGMPVGKALVSANSGDTAPGGSFVTSIDGVTYSSIATAIVPVTITPPAATGDAAMPDAVVTAEVHIDATHSVTAATASAFIAAPDAYGENTMLRVLPLIAGRSEDGNALSITSGSSEGIYLNFDSVLPVAGREVLKAELSFSLALGESSPGSYNMTASRVTSAWTEGQTGSVSSSTPTDSFNAGFSGVNVVDVSNIVKSWESGNPQYGIKLVRTGTSLSLTMVETSTSPSLKVTYQLSADITNAVTGPMTASVSGGTHTVGADRFVNISAPAITATALMRAGSFFTPDAYVVAPAMTSEIAELHPTVIGGSSTSVTAGVFSADLTGVDVGFTNVTDRLFEIPPMAAVFKWVVPYKPEEDRYLNFIPLTVDADDIWYKMEETAGSVAVDALVSDTPESGDNFRSNGAYVGAPTFQVEGPELRKATHFGADDYLQVNYIDGTEDSIFREPEFTIEFSIKTTDANGVVVAGKMLLNTAGPNNQIRLVNGELHFFEGDTRVARVAKNIADGEWHHVVVSLPNNDDQVAPISDNRPSFVKIDGITEFKRFNSFGRGGGFEDGLMPDKVMVGVEGDMRDFIFRMNYAIGEDTAAKLYYEWSNANIVDAAPITATADMGQESTGRGNMKKMLLVYGLPTKLTFSNNGNYERGNYYSPFSGVRLQNWQKVSPSYYSQAIAVLQPVGEPFMQGGTQSYYPVTPFPYSGYMVYPVSIVAGNVPSADGLINGDYIDSAYLGRYIDDHTGLNRFVDLEKDLTQDVEDFDAVTVFNYPAYAPASGQNSYNTSGPSLGSEYPFSQRGLGLKDSEWAQARDNFRDSLLRVWGRGLHLWITEPDMAQHLGFIQSWDEHGFGEWPESPEYASPYSSTNQAGEALDLAHGGVSGIVLSRSGDYVSLYQSNIFRKIVATEPGLTTIGSAEITARAVAYKADGYAQGSVQYMHDIVNRPGGLRIGDTIEMSHYNRFSNLGFGQGQNSTALKTNSVTAIWSARPQGIIGKVISKEIEQYAGPYGSTVQNPYKDNVYTIVVEPGTSVRGVTGQGRVFIEFMDHDAYEDGVIANMVRSGSNGSTWSYDSRRSDEQDVAIVGPKVILSEGAAQQVTPTVQYVAPIDDVDVVFYKYVGMNRRGLAWLAGDEEVELGDFKVYAPSMTASAEIVPGTNQAARTNTVTGTAMKATATIVKPANFPDADVEILPMPMEALAQFSGVNMTVAAPPMTAEVGGPAPIVNTSGDRIRVFIDSDRTIRLFLKEDEY